MRFYSKQYTGSPQMSRSLSFFTVPSEITWRDFKTNSSSLNWNFTLFLDLFWSFEMLLQVLFNNKNCNIICCHHGGKKAEDLRSPSHRHDQSEDRGHCWLLREPCVQGAEDGSRWWVPREETRTGQAKEGHWGSCSGRSQGRSDKANVGHGEGAQCGLQDSQGQGKGPQPEELRLSTLSAPLWGLKEVQAWQGKEAHHMAEAPPINSPHLLQQENVDSWPSQECPEQPVSGKVSIWSPSHQLNQASCRGYDVWSHHKRQQGHGLALVPMWPEGGAEGVLGSNGDSCQAVDWGELPQRRLRVAAGWSTRAQSKEDPGLVQGEFGGLLAIKPVASLMAWLLASWLCNLGHSGKEGLLHPPQERGWPEGSSGQGVGCHGAGLQLEVMHCLLAKCRGHGCCRRQAFWGVMHLCVSCQNIKFQCYTPSGFWKISTCLKSPVHFT